ncbi:hypothetical protein P9112_013072 [Eukaryota sp. TZLM1-RC]
MERVCVLGACGRPGLACTTELLRSAKIQKIICPVPSPCFKREMKHLEELKRLHSEKIQLENLDTDSLNQEYIKNLLDTTNTTSVVIVFNYNHYLSDDINPDDASTEEYEAVAEIISAVKDLADIKTVVFSSLLNVDNPDFSMVPQFVSKRNQEERLKSTLTGNKHLRIVRFGYFFDNFMRPNFIGRSGIINSPLHKDTIVSGISTQDAGRILASVTLNPQTFGQTIDCVADTFTIGQLAHHLGLDVDDSQVERTRQNLPQAVRKMYEQFDQGFFVGQSSVVIPFTLHSFEHWISDSMKNLKTQFKGKVHLGGEVVATGISTQ